LGDEARLAGQLVEVEAVAALPRRAMGMRGSPITPVDAVPTRPTSQSDAVTATKRLRPGSISLADEEVTASELAKYGAREDN
jgi:hypothetical protein